MTDTESRSFEVEKAALVGDRLAVTRLVSALRKYRAAVKELLGKRWRDGECDAVTLNSFANAIEEVEEELGHSS